MPHNVEPQATVALRPEVHVDLRPCAKGCYVRARVEGAADRLPRAFTGVFASRDEAVTEAAGLGARLASQVPQVSKGTAGPWGRTIC